MFQEKRPTCVTVIGWVWIIVGGLSFFSAIMGLITSYTITNLQQAEPSSSEQLPAIFKYFNFIAIGQMFFALLGFISGIYFLNLKAWSRKVLEILTWILILFIAGFGVFFVYQWMTFPTADNAFGFGVFEIIFMVIIFCIYGVPLGIMARYLRGQKVKSAMIGSAEHVDSESRDGTRVPD